MIALAAAAATLTVLGVLVLAQQIRPAPPRLGAALARIQPTGLPTTAPSATPRLSERVGDWLAAHLAQPAGVLAVPHTDLALLEQTVERFMLRKLAGFLTGIAVPSAVYGALALLGFAPPVVLPAAVTVLLAAVVSFLPDVNVRTQGRRLRREFRFAFACYLQLVLLEREAGAALNAALEGPVTVADAWPFQRINAALATARRAQQPPWRALADLGERIGVHDLVDLAYSAQIAGAEGARMHDVLAAKITAMRHEAAAAIRADANARTTAMWVPTSLLMLGFVILVGFPFFARLLGTG